MQVLDTPGTLNRQEKMNNIEKTAYLALKHLAQEIIYVFDPMESYPMVDQLKLYKKTKNYGKPLYVYCSRTDLAPVPEEVQKLHPMAIEALKKKVEELSKQTEPAETD